MRKLLFILSIIALLTISCTRNNKDTAILGQVEACMDTYPDSALVLLRQIKNPEKLHGKTRANYALLLTQAQDKNYLDSLQSDSLIGIAVDYYRNKDDKVKAGKAFFYYGKVMATQGRDTIALKAYLDAKKVLAKTKEYKMLYLIVEHIGRIYFAREMYQLALDNYQNVVQYSKIENDTTGIVYGYRNIAWVYLSEQKTDSAYWCVQHCMNILQGDSTSRAFPSILQIEGIIERERGHNLKAIDCFQRAVNLTSDSHLLNHYNYSLGSIYMQTGQYDKAKTCFEQGLTSKEIFTQSGAYNYLYLLEKKKSNYAMALLYKEKSDSLLNISQDKDLQNKIVTIQRNHEAETLLLNNKLLEQQKRSQLYIGISIFLLFIILSVFSYFWIKKQYLKIYRKRVKLHIDKELKIYKDNESAINHYVHQIEELGKRETLTAEETKNKIGHLNQEMQILLRENKEIRENFGVSAMFFLGQLKKGLLTVNNMTQLEKERIFEYVDLFSGNSISRLKKDYSLNDNNLMLAVLIKLGFSTSELILACDCEENSIYKKKQRLKTMFHLDKNDSLESFLHSDFFQFVH